MNCPRCGYSLSTGTISCPGCGERIIDIANNPDWINTEELINAYIGNNAEKLKKGGFSFCTLLFGTIYFLYRKMWLYGIIWIILDALIGAFLTSYAIVIGLIIRVVMAIIFKRVYISHVKSEVEKIKKDNDGVVREQLVYICKSKGGTLNAVFLIFIVFVSIGLIGFLFYQFVWKKNNISTNSLTFGALSYQVPDTFESYYDTVAIKGYKTSSAANKDCYLTISRVDAELYDDDVSKYIQSDLNTPVDIDVDKSIINDKTWYSTVVSTTYRKYYYYGIVYDDYIYLVNLEVNTSGGGSCSKEQSAIVDSLRLGEN